MLSGFSNDILGVVVEVSMRQITLTLIRVIVFALTLTLWMWVLWQPFSPILNLVSIIGTLLAIFPTVWIGRKLLDIKPTTEQVEWVTTAVHAILMVLFGIAIIKAIQTGNTWRGLAIPISRSLGILLVYITGAVTLLTVANLAQGRHLL